MKSLSSEILIDLSEGSTLSKSPIIEDFVESGVSPPRYGSSLHIKKHLAKNGSPYSYTRTGQGNECEDGAKVLFTIGHKPNAKCKPLPILGHHNCGRATCSRTECYEPVITKQAREIERRLHAFYDLEIQKGVNPGHLKHIQFSPHQRKSDGRVILGKYRNKQVWTSEDIKADGASHLERALYAILKDAFQGGYFAGTIIYHQERQKHLDGSSCEDRDCKRRHVWKDGPHFHFIGYGFLVNSEAFHARTNWIYHNIDPGASRDAFETARYQLSHSAHFSRSDSRGVVRSRPAYRSVGLLSSYHLGQFTAYTVDEPQLCKCQDELHKFRFPEGLDLEGLSMLKYYEQEDLGVYSLRVNYKCFYQKLHYRSGCQGRYIFIYPADVAEVVAERAERSRSIREFQKELQEPLWGDSAHNWGIFNNPALFYKRPKRVVRPRPKWHDSHSWNGTEMVGWKYENS